MRLWRFADRTNRGVADDANDESRLRIVASDHDALANSRSVWPESARKALCDYRRVRGLIARGKRSPGDTLDAHGLKIRRVHRTRRHVQGRIRRQRCTVRPGRNQRQRRGEGSQAHTGKGPQPVESLCIQLPTSVRCERRRREKRIGIQPPGHVKAWIRRVQSQQLRDEAGPDEQQDQGHHDLGNESYRPSPNVGAHAALDDHRAGHPGQAPRREQSTEHRGDGGADARGEHKCTPIERQIELNGEDTRGRRHRAFQELPDPQGENDTGEVPPTARRRASVSSCRSTRARGAPSARRTANSRCRRAPRASMR